MNSDAQAENVEAIACGLEPPHADVWVCDLDDGVLWLSVHTDAQRMSALRQERIRRVAEQAYRGATVSEILDHLDALLKAGV